jgi:hypothetical protein
MSVDSAREQRTSIRFDKVFRVSLSGDGFGELDAVARNISLGGMLIETPSLPTLGSVVKVHFQVPGGGGDELTAMAEVKNHYVFNYNENGCLRWARGIGVKFLEFLVGDVPDLAEQLQRERMRTLH